MKNKIALLVLLLLGVMAYGQEIHVTYKIGEKYSDRYKYSNLQSISDDGNGGTILIRSYYSGMILKPKGYYIEHYNKNLELISDFNYKMKGSELVNSFVKNGQIHLLLLNYNRGANAYEYIIHKSPVTNYNFIQKTILSIESEEVEKALDKNFYNRNFSSGFTTTALFNKDKSAFLISTHYKKRKINKHTIYLFNAELENIIEHDFSSHVENKNYAFEDIVTSKDLNEVYIIGKAYFKKKRFVTTERKFQYELIKITSEEEKITSFDSPGKYSEALKPILDNGKLICVGFYADRKDNRYNGISYFEIDLVTLEMKSKKYNAFSQQFMLDKFGKDRAKQIKNLVFKNIDVTDNKDILFNAEEYFVTSSYQSNGTGSRIKVRRYHYNDMVSVKLNESGDMAWARNINKTEVTQGDGAYASYSSLTKGDDTYFFISTAGERPQQLSNKRIIFRQGYSRNRNVFVIKLNSQGDLSYKKMIDDKDARLPLMVSIPFKNNKENSVLFYAKRGSKKQLIKVNIK
ncbi:MAG: hypothetical protein V3U92_15405 [Cellulophaga sp.]